MFKKIKAIAKKDKSGGDLDTSEQHKQSNDVKFAAQEKDPRAEGRKKDPSDSEKRKKSSSRDRDRDRSEGHSSEHGSRSREHRKPRDKDGKERKSTRKSVKYKLDEDGNKVPRERGERSDGEKKEKRRSSSKPKNATDREKKIALHAKAKREAEKRRNTTEEMQDMSMNDDTKDYEPGLKVELRGKGLTKGGSTSVHAQRFDNIYAAPQSMLGNFVAPIYEKSDDDVEFLLDALADNFVFNSLDESELETLVNAFENYEVKKGETIIKQGETGGHFYILRSGKVAFVVDGNEVGRAVPGNSFGELALLYNAPRAATCMAADGKAGLWRVDQVTFRRLLAAHTIQNDNQTKDVLRKVPFLSDLDDEFIHRISEALTTVYYDAGDTIFECGSKGNVFYVIREGKVEYENRKHGIKALGPGDHFWRAGDCEE